jgi:hypothetical protein
MSRGGAVAHAGHASVDAYRIAGSISRRQLTHELPARSLADAAQAIATAARQIQMKMVVVMTVGVGAEHGRELTAGAVVHRLQKGLLALLAAPTTLHCQHVAVTQ